MTLQLLHSEFRNTVYEENLIFFFISAGQRNYYICSYNPG
jgi:hypothetical protein